MQNSSKIRKTIRTAALHGAIAWTVYGIVECIFSSFLPWLIKPSHVYVPVHWAFTVLLFFFYPLLGAIVGGLAGFVLHIVSLRSAIMRNLQFEAFLSAFATLTIVLAYLINFLLNLPESFTLSEFPPFFMSMMLVIACALSAISNTWFNRFRSFVNCWTASLVLLGLPWINKELFGYSSFASLIDISRFHRVERAFFSGSLNFVSSKKWKSLPPILVKKRTGQSGHQAIFHC